MAITKHFGTCAGSPVDLLNPSWASLHREFSHLIGRDHIPGESLVRSGSLFAFGTCAKCGGLHPSARRIEYASQPSRHVCNAQCMGARGPSCECSCGGRNHGAGFVASGLLFA